MAKSIAKIECQKGAEPKGVVMFVQWVKHVLMTSRIRVTNEKFEFDSWGIYIVSHDACEV